MQVTLDRPSGWARPGGRQLSLVWRIPYIATAVFLALLGVRSPCGADPGAPVDSTASDSAVVSRPTTVPVDSTASDSARVASPAVVPAPIEAPSLVPPRTPATRTAGTLSVSDTVTVLPPVDVRGARGVIPERTTTTSVRVERGRANRFLPGTIADALVTVPGLDLIKTGPWASQLSLRGLSGDRVVLMVDGVRMNSVRGHGVQPSLVSLDRLDAVELIPGAGSAQVGSDALGGVVNIVTHRSLFADHPITSLIVQARAADPGLSWSNAVGARFLGPRVGLELSGSLGGLDHLNTPRGALDNSGDREDDFGVRAAARLGRTTLDLEHTQHAVHDAGLPAFSLPVAGEAPAATSGNSGSYPLQQRRAQRLEFTMQGRGWQPDVRVLGVHQRYYTGFDEAVTDSIYLRGRVVGSTTNASSDRVTTQLTSVEPSLRFRGPGALRLFGEARLEQAEGPVLHDQVTRNLAGEITASSHDEGVSVPPADRSGWAAGLAASHLTHGLKIESGLRYDHLRSRADSVANSPTAKLDVVDSRTSAEIGLSRAFGLIEPYTHLATGFRAPNLDERYYNSTIHGGLRLFGNPDLESERSLSYELGLRTAGELPEWLRGARLSVYRSNVDDLISFRYIGSLYLVPRFQYFNVQRARLEGIEATAQMRLGTIQVDVSGGVPTGKDLDTGKRLEDVGTARAALEIVCPLRRLLPSGAVSTRVRWSDALTDVSAPLRRPAFSTTAVEASFVTGRVYTVVAVRNLWNHFYYEPQSFIPEAGRTFAISLRREFRP